MFFEEYLKKQSETILRLTQDDLFLIVGKLFSFIYLFK